MITTKISPFKELKTINHKYVLPGSLCARVWTMTATVCTVRAAETCFSLQYTRLLRGGLIVLSLKNGT